jgi:hypothetical protein
MENYTNVAHKSYVLSKKSGALVIPQDCTAKICTLFTNELPDRNLVIFNDGSELIMTFNNEFFWTKDCEWEAENITASKLKE